ncbi:MAG: cysteine desulfurase-like protein [Ardenticatenaceae bacterium]|nr:cysteine desulfurase-like protein [Ardenticatenaceae bacterium]
MPSFIDIDALRQQFPALQKQVNGRPVIYLDGPSGTQVPQTVIDSMMSYLLRDNSNRGGPSINSQRTDFLVSDARRSTAQLLNARRPEEIIFGQNMTALTYNLSRALGQTWSAGDEIVVSELDHHANIDPWLQAAAEREVKVRWLPVDRQTCTLQLEKLPTLLTERTKLVALTFASNAVGSITDVAMAANMAHTAGAKLFVDAVHYTPHGPIDVRKLDCDFLAASAYKFFAPHLGILYGKYEHLNELKAYKLQSAPSFPPDKWENGTQSFESMAGLIAAINYLSKLGHRATSLLNADATSLAGLTGRRRLLHKAMTTIAGYERQLSARFLSGAEEIPGLRIYGLTDPSKLQWRTPTFSIRMRGRHPQEIGRYLAQKGVFVWTGDFHATTLMNALKLNDSGGTVRIGFVHYNTAEEVDEVLNLLERMK